MTMHDDTERDLNLLSQYLTPAKHLRFRLARAAIGGAIMAVGLTYRDSIGDDDEEPCCEGCAKGEGCEGCGGAKVLRRPRRPPRPRQPRAHVPETPRQRANRRPSPQDLPEAWRDQPHWQHAATRRESDDDGAPSPSRRLVGIERSINELAAGLARVEDRMVEAHVQHAIHVAADQVARHVERFWGRHKGKLGDLKEGAPGAKPEDDLTLMEVLTHEIRELDWWDSELYERTLIPLLDPAEPDSADDTEPGSGSQIVS